MKHLKLIFGILLLNGFFLLSFSQTKIAEWGKAGIFIKLTDDLNLIKSGKFEIVRKNGTSENILGKTSTPKNKTEFEKRLKYFIRFLPDFNLPHKKMIERLWNSFKSNNTIDSLYFWGTTPVVKLSLGVMFLDTTATRDKIYSYKVGYLSTKKGKQIEQKINNVKYIGKADIGKVSFDNSQLQSNYLLLTFSAKPKYPSAVQVYRREGTNGAFEKIHPVVGLSSGAGNLKIIIIDSTISIGSVYQYFVTPVNIFNLEGKNSDTTLCAAYDFTKAFLPSDFKAESSDSLRGIKLTWSPVTFPFVKSIVIERSNIFDSLFTQIAEISNTKNMFVDYNAEPMKKYYYRIKLVGLLNEETHYSARIFGMYEDKIPPLPPFELKAKALKNGVRLSWVSLEPYIKGFYVYRNNGVNNKLQVSSKLIQGGDSLIVYQDTSSGLKAGYTYMYSVIAENTSHVQSSFSDTVYVRTLIKEKLIPPTNLQAVLEPNGVQLYWDDMREINKTVIGFFIYKEEISNNKNHTKPVKLDTLLFPESNNYFDNRITKGMSYKYFVQSVGLNESLSKLSSGIIVKPKIIKPLAPANISAVSTKNGILLKWDKPLDETIKKFTLFRYERGNKPIKLSSFKYMDNNSYLDKTVKKGKLYFYYMISVNSDGIKSKMSNEVGAEY